MVSAGDAAYERRPFRTGDGEVAQRAVLGVTDADDAGREADFDAVAAAVLGVRGRPPPGDLHP